MDSLQESQYNVSRHLKDLKVAGLVNERKTGRWVFYSLTKTKEDFHKLILRALESIPEEVFLIDIERLKLRLSLREGGKCVIGLKSPERKKVVTQLRKIRSKRRAT
jgi:ArsR family transcriptional regulator